MPRSRLLPLLSLSLLHTHENQVLFCLSWLKVQFAKAFSEHSYHISQTWQQDLCTQCRGNVLPVHPEMISLFPSFLPSASGSSVQGTAALPEHSRELTVPGPSGNGCTAGNGCWYLWEWLYIWEWLPVLWEWLLVPLGMTVGISGNGCTAGNGCLYLWELLVVPLRMAVGTSGNGCWSLWVLEQTQPLPSAPRQPQLGPLIERRALNAQPWDKILQLARRQMPK